MTLPNTTLNINIHTSKDRVMVPQGNNFASKYVPRVKVSRFSALVCSLVRYLIVIKQG